MYIVEIFSGRGVSTLWFLVSLLGAVVIHRYTVKCKVQYRYFMLFLIPMISILVSNTVFITNPVKNLSTAFILYCVGIALIKSFVAYWFLEISYLSVNKLLNASTQVITPFLLVWGGTLLA